MSRRRADGARQRRDADAPVVAVSPWKRRFDSFALPRQVATTAHLCAIYPFAVEADLGVSGAFLGSNRLSGGGFTFDLHTAYDAGLVQGPNMLVSGAGAFGKSAVVKAYLYRSAAFSGDRFISIIDPKGEWVPLAEELGLTALRLRPGGGIIVNPLDTGPHAGHVSRQDAVAHRISVASTLLAIALGQTELSAGQSRTVSVCLQYLSDRAGPTSPTLPDLRAVLADPPADVATALDTTPADLVERRRPLLDAIAVLLDHDLRGICDGPTSVHLDWARTPGLVLDLSALLSHRRALRLVLTAATGWMAGVLYGQPTRHKINIIDEGWAALEDLAIVRMLQDQWRLGRQWGCANILITHALADLRSQVDDRAAQGKIAEGLLNTTSVRVFLHQNPEQIGR
ncbi:MAG: ATP-binding protein, partial [Frankia sp.]